MLLVAIGSESVEERVVVVSADVGIDMDVIVALIVVIVVDVMLLD